MVLPKISESSVRMGQLLQIKFSPKTRSMICSENIYFFHSGKKWLWVENDKEKCVMLCQTCSKYPSIIDKSSPLFCSTAKFHVDPLWRVISICRSKNLFEPMQHKSKERATTELKDVPIGNCSHTETQKQTIMDSDDKSYQSEMSNTCILQIRTERLIL